MQNNHQRNQTIDVLRIPASFCVILCHIQWTGDAKTYSMALARWAVPFFLLVSGWYLYREDPEQQYAAAKRFLLSTVKLLAVSVLFIGTVNTGMRLVSGKSAFGWLTSFFGRKGNSYYFLMCNWARFLSSVMWYLFALTYAMVVFTLLARWKGIRWAYLLIVPLLVINLLRAEIMHLAWYRQGNWLLTTLPFLLLGHWLHKSRWAEKTSGTASMLLTVLGIAITAVEARFVDEQIIYAGTIPLVLGIFTWGIASSGRQWPKSVAWFGRYCTPYIFILHCSLRDIVYAVWGEPSGAARWWMPLFFFVLSGLIGVCLHKGMERLRRQREKGRAEKMA